MLFMRNKIFGWAASCLFMLLAVSCASTKTLVVMLPDESSPRGAVAIGQGDRSTILDTPMTAAKVDVRGRVKKESISLVEVEQNFTEAFAAQPPESISFILYYEEGSTVVVPESRETLLELFAEVAKRQAVEVQVTGHTDTVGSEAYNDRLSNERAKAIKDSLIKQGLKASFVRAVGRGERELLIPTPDNVREPRNRRVQVIVR